jgi:hypothetical protein
MESPLFDSTYFVTAPSGQAEDSDMPDSMTISSGDLE